MTFYGIIKAGKRIIVDTTGTKYTSTAFYLKDNRIWLENDELGTFPHPTFTPKTFNEHITNMLVEGFNIITVNA